MKTGWSSVRVALLVVGFVGMAWAVAAIWWWALRGMSADVGTATMATTGLLMFGGFGSATYPGWSK